ncbi:Oidioi.mRNA.OKI2018_I69.chr2.g4133.t1.cds [Oikopleura dioica]|uniref:Oidioi.mRNA.OKI2018_I69.chr2.g4133.t1.cds n=1 Tax=Oikopleura dioica TaxID=34765 RepID=A0ABN7SZU3_OIKDI|nr:Oidioi.mRNA.OKI2018_I69.chr2.g4133.t1.cds [Oikopleura dioica]
MRGISATVSSGMQREAAQQILKNMKTVGIFSALFGFAAAQAPRPTMPGTVDTMSEFREEFGTFVPESIKLFSPFRDNVITMVSLGLKENGFTRRDIKNALEDIFTHGCHCGWNKGRHALEKTKVVVDDLDQDCLNFDHCVDCLKMDQCSIETLEFSPLVEKNKPVSCDNLAGDSCQYNTCLCSKNLADKILEKIVGSGEYPFVGLSFTEFHDQCMKRDPVDVNTQLRKPKVNSDAERQCCGAYPNRAPFTYKPNGLACCAGTTLYEQKDETCCSSGQIFPIGEVC